MPNHSNREMTLDLADKVLGSTDDEQLAERVLGSEETYQDDGHEPVERSERTAEASQADVDLMPGGGYGSDRAIVGTLHKGYRPSSAANLTDGSTRRALERMGDFPAEHSVAPPQRLSKARAVVEQVVGEAVESLLRVAEIPKQKNAWRMDVMQATEAAFRAGRTAPEDRGARPDFEAMEDQAVAQARGLVARARDARTAYDKLADELLSADTRRATLEKALQAAHTDALQAAQDALTKAEGASTAYNALLALSCKDGLERDPRQSVNMPRISEHITALTSELGKLDPERPVLVNTGATRLDMATRAGLANAPDPASRYSIWRLEHSENFAVSAFTRGWPVLEKATGATNYELKARSARY